MSVTNYEGCWSEDGQVFYFENGGWGVSKKGRTVWLGKEADVIKKHPVTNRTKRAARRTDSQI